MPPRKIAVSLISAENKSERRKILSKLPRENDAEIAQELKNICYEFWTTAPTKSQKAALALQNLVEINPQKEIEAASFWVSGIAALTRGRLESATENLDKSAEIFHEIGKNHEAAQTKVAKLIALALLGNYAEAVETGEQAIKIFEIYGDELAIGKIENNIGNISIRQENLARAEKSFLSSRKRFLKVGNISELIVSEIGLANTYSAMNNFRNADKFYRKTLGNTQKLKMFLRQAEIETNIGSLALYRGKYDEALKFLESSRQKYEELKMPHQTAITELEIADAYLELNLTNEAFEIYKRIVPKLSRFKIQGEKARSHNKFGQAAMILGNKRTARKEFEKAAILYEKEKNFIGLAQVFLAQAQLELNEKKFSEALKLVEKTQKILEKLKNQRFAFSACFLKGEIWRNLDEFEKGEKILSETYAQSVRKNQPNIAQICQISLAKIAEQKGEITKAKNHYQKAISLIERLRAPLAAEEFRMSFLSDKLLPFQSLAKIYLAEKKLQKAFLLIEKSRARTLSENLNNGNFLQNGNEISPKLAEKLRDLREELNYFYSRLTRAKEVEIGNLQTEIKRREKHLSEVTRQIESTQSARAEIGALRSNLSETQKLKDLRQKLGKQNSLIEFVNFNGNLSAFVITHRKTFFIENFAKEAEIIEFLEALQFQFGTLRYGAKNLKNLIGELKKRADFYLEKLYEKLFEPLQNFIADKNLVIVPVGVLHYVPFHALRKNHKYLIEDREISYTPSAEIWRILTKKTTKKAENILLFGFADERIPLVNQEIKAIAEKFPNKKIFTGKTANFANYTKNAPNFDILHLACHGQFRADNPLFSSLHLADGFVTVKDICSQKLKANLVTLSACETGLNKIFAGDEILGLARGFLSAGVNSLVLSLWTVSDEAATELMKDFYAELKRGASVSASLRKAQINFIKRGAHPYFWSPFALIGG